MMNKILSIILIFFAISFAKAQDKPLFEISSPNSLVYDNVQFFSAQEKQALEDKLNQYSRQTSTQIVVAVTPDLYGYDIDDYATRLLEKWKPGQADKNNGLVILIKPKTDTKGEIAISTGYGMEHLITDALSKRIIETEVIPEFKQGNYYLGVDKAINTIISLSEGEYTADSYMERTEKGSVATGVIIMIVIFLFFRFFGRRRGGGRSMGGSSLPFWMMMGAMGSSNSGGYGGFSSGGGGFGGFGGGMGGGGGASGSW